MANKFNNSNIIELDFEYYSKNFESDIDSAETSQSNDYWESNEEVYLNDKKERSLLSLSFNNKNLRTFNRFYLQNSYSDIYNTQKGSNLDNGVLYRRDRANLNNHKTETIGFNSYSFYPLKNDKLTYGINLKKDKISNTFKRIDRYNSNGLLITDENGNPTNSTQDRSGFCPSTLDNNGIYINYTKELGYDDSWFFSLYSDYYQYKVTANPNTDYLNRIQEIQDERDNANATLGLVDPFMIELLEKYDKKSFSNALVLGKKFNNNFVISSKLSKSSRNPTPEELSLVFEHGTDFIYIPNSNLKKEKSLSSEISFSRFTKSNNQNLTIFYNSFNLFS